MIPFGWQCSLYCPDIELKFMFAHNSGYHWSSVDTYSNFERYGNFCHGFFCTLYKQPIIYLKLNLIQPEPIWNLCVIRGLVR